MSCGVFIFHVTFQRFGGAPWGVHSEAQQGLIPPGWVFYIPELKLEVERAHLFPGGDWKHKHLHKSNIRPLMFPLRTARYSRACRSSHVRDLMKDRDKRGGKNSQHGVSVSFLPGWRYSFQSARVCEEVANHSRCSKTVMAVSHGGRWHSQRNVFEEAAEVNQGFWEYFSSLSHSMSWGWAGSAMTHQRHPPQLPCMAAVCCMYVWARACDPLNRLTIH